jgi:gamma-glutamyl-gamma-aminobutyraldehyde dehydrogenase
MASLPTKETGEITPTEEGELSLVSREPAGVVAAVVPWNFPLTLGGWKLAPALAAGCTVVLKTAEQSPLSMQRVAELGVEAGLPPGVFNVISGDGHVVGRRLGEHPDVEVLTFTGSTEVGRHFMRYSAESNLKRVYLELGGKSPNIILPDAPDLEAAADAAAWAIYFNSGEMCTAGSRLVVHADVADRVVERSTRPPSGSRPTRCFRTPRWALWSMSAACSVCFGTLTVVSLQAPHCASAGGAYSPTPAAPISSPPW